MSGKNQGILRWMINGSLDYYLMYGHNIWDNESVLLNVRVYLKMKVGHSDLYFKLQRFA